MANGKKLINKSSTVVQHLAVHNIQHLHNYSTFEAQYLQRMRFENKKNSSSGQYSFCNGFDSDTGSDLRHDKHKKFIEKNKTNIYKNCSVKRCVSTDSGFSSTKTDSGSSSDFSCNGKSARRTETLSNWNQQDEFNYIATPSSRINVQPTKCFDFNKAEAFCEDTTRIEKKQREILEQCYQNEALKKFNYNVNPSVFDCSLLNKSSSPLDVFSNPLSVYVPSKYDRHKSKILLKKKKKNSFQKLKNSVQNLKIKKNVQQNGLSLMTSSYVQTANNLLNLNLNQSSIKQNNNHLSFSSNIKNTNQNNVFKENLVNHQVQDNEDEDEILTRLFTRPNKKPLLAKLFEKVGGQSYSMRNIDKLEEQDKFEEQGKHLKKTSSNRSIPDALRSIWTKLQRPYVERERVDRSSQHLSKTSSMPLIYQENEQTLAFLNSNRNCINIIDSDANYKQPVTCKKTVKKPSEIKSLNYVGKDKRSSSCSELTSNKSHFFNPKIAYAPYLIAFQSSNDNLKTKSPNIQYPYVEGPTFHCQCCQHNMNKNQYQSFYREQAVAPFYREQGVAPVYREQAVAPLDVQIEREKKATRRKVSDLYFDSFV
ncbi:myb-like protein D [Hydra vulgaris]|uniref:myb-like protein D n=1 Tax=Hydra vulgaris TaxID=6087 RepID=UPI0002B43193|nr:myb-like protein D [Hydra vulgaris]XP_004208888.1 myb-like protein D [Hydra vulgaris]XP_012558851.1 myb-like protein D [Hydra vulgaris]